MALRVTIQVFTKSASKSFSRSFPDRALYVPGSLIVSSFENLDAGAPSKDTVLQEKLGSEREKHKYAMELLDHFHCWKSSY